MTPEERSLLDSLFQRLRQAEGQPRDPEAERHIRETLQAQPAAAYYMAQSLLVAQHALEAAQPRIEELERQLKEAQQKAQQPQGGVSSFLSGALGLGGRREAPQQANPSQPNSPQASPSQASPWGGGGGMPPGQGYSQPPQPQGGFRSPWGGGAPAGGYPQAPQGGGFMSGALQTAAGVAGGMLAANALSSLFSHSSSPFASAAASHAQTPATETVINNYYGDSQGQDDDGDSAPPAHHQTASADDYQSDDLDFGGDDGSSDDNWA